jgi:hypothetical protein
VSAITPAVDGTSLDFLGESAESWIVENESERGYGAIIPRVKGDWVQVGALVGLLPETSTFWGAGIIRRITRDEYQQRRVGLQLLSHATIPVLVSVAPDASSGNVECEGDGAVLLSTKPDRNSEVALLLRVGTFTPRHRLQMRVRDKLYLLIPARFVEGGDDFDLGTFKVMGPA